MNHVPPADIWAVRVIGALYELASFPVQDALPIREVGLTPFPVPLHHLLRAARASLHTIEHSHGCSPSSRAMLQHACEPADCAISRFIVAQYLML